MKPSTPSSLRRTLAVLAAGAMLAGAALAGDKPMIHVLVGFPPGAGTDTVARIYAEALAARLDADVVVENKTGAGGKIAAQALRQAPADSNTLMVAVDHQVVMLPVIMRNPGFDVKKDMQPVGRLVSFHACLAVPAASPAKDLAGYVEAVRKAPELGSYGVPAPGSQAQFVGFVVGQHYKVPLKAIGYRGAAPAISDLIGGQIPAAIVPCDALVQYRAAGKIRILGVAANERIKAVPDVPTFAELGVKMPTDNFIAAYAASSMKPELLKRVRQATQAMFGDSKVVERLASTQMEPAYASPDALAHIVETGTTFWGDQVRQSHFQLQ